MSVTHASELLRADLLDGVTIALGRARASSSSPQVGPPRDLFATAVLAGCEAVGAKVLELGLTSGHSGGASLEESAVEDGVGRLLVAAGTLQLLVVDGAGLFAAEAAPAATAAGVAASDRAALVGALEVSWNVTRALVNQAFIVAEARSTSSPAAAVARRIVYIAPAPDAGEHAEAARAGLENMARTLSIEWARHGITLVAIVPRASHASAAGEVAALVAYLASPAGAYFSGCLLDLRGPGRAGPGML
jgi:NAD(P)-dependent dehydrogenase (short-subunit alcohol dehydrogenase family)